MKEHNSEPTDHQLVVRVQKGDKRAFDLLVLKYQYKLQAIVGRFIRDADEVADVTKKLLSKLIRHYPNFAVTVSSTLGCIELPSIRQKII